MNEFWRKNQRPGTTLFGHYRPRSLWQRLYDWLFVRAKE